MDWPNADKIKERLKKALPANLQDDEDEDKTPEQMEAKAAAEAEAQELKALQRDMALLGHRKATAEAVESEAKARTATKAAEDAEAGINKQTVDATNAETSRLKAITAKGFPLPAEAQAILAPLVTQAVMAVLASPDVLPMSAQFAIAAGSIDDSMQPPPEAQDQQIPDEGIAA